MHTYIIHIDIYVCINVYTGGSKWGWEGKRSERQKKKIKRPMNEYSECRTNDMIINNKKKKKK